LRTMSSAEFRFRPAMFSIVLSAQLMGNKTLKHDGPVRRGHARPLMAPGVNRRGLSKAFQSSSRR
ncbi:hypothetical protein O1W68_21470, partial [Rhodococcus sp. H36-A4]|uniref:hypothetical protein n=1 Tax=Rhodococcus sp. H36-A4 TaxID=3004353 RepID=UPI0022AF2466